MLRLANHGTPDEAAAGSRLDALAAIAITLVAALPALRMALGPCGLTPDSVKYLECARAIVEGAPLSPQSAALSPGLPLLLAAAHCVTDEPWRLVPGANALLCILIALAAWRLAGRILARPAAAFAAMATAAAPVLHDQSALLCTELPYMLALLLALDAITQPPSADPAQAEPSARRAASIGGWIAVASLLRPTGLLLAAAASWALAYRRPTTLRRLALIWAIALAPLVLWKLYAAPFATEAGYAAQLAGAATPNEGIVAVAARIAARIPEYGLLRLREVAQLVLPSRVAWSLHQPPLADSTAFLIGGSVVVLLGWQALIRRSVGATYALLHLAVLAVWPFNEGPRFVLPLAPLIWIAVGAAVERLLQFAQTASPVRWIRRMPATTAIAICAALLAGALFDTALGSRRLPHRHAGFAKLHARAAELSLWMRDHVAPRPGAWLARLPQGDPRKLALAWAGYQAHRPGIFEDLSLTKPTASPAPASVQWVFIAANHSAPLQPMSPHAVDFALGDLLVHSAAAAGDIPPRSGKIAYSGGSRLLGPP